MVMMGSLSSKVMLGMMMMIMIINIYFWNNNEEIQGIDCIYVLVYILLITLFHFPNKVS